MADTPRTNRRDFLQGKAAAQALADVVQSTLPPVELPAPQVSDQSYLVHLTRRAMACQFEVFLNAGEHDRATAVALQSLDIVEQLESQLTVYRDTSEISRINRLAAAAPVEVEPRLFRLLTRAKQISLETCGAYDVTAGPLSKVWGFTRRAGVIPDGAVLDEARARVGSRHIELDGERCTIRFLQPGIELNLGSIGKGYALDRAAELFEAAAVGSYLLHGGNSSVLARGSGPDRDGWLVGVRNPLKPDRRLGEIWLRNRALATSGSGTQFFMHEGRRYGHILDPRTGWPAAATLSATVIAHTAADADALSTAFYVLGPDGARQYCDEHPDVGALLLCPGKRTGALDVHTLGLEPGIWQKADDG